MYLIPVVGRRSSGHLRLETRFQVFPNRAGKILLLSLFQRTLLFDATSSLPGGVLVQ